MQWFQRTLELPRFRRGFHRITRHVEQALPELAFVEIGLLHLFLQHTSASLTLNEAADPEVAADLETWYDAAVAEDFPFRHTSEGPDDMPAHVKASLLGTSLTVPVGQGRLLLGTWQGIFLCEHRNRASARKLVLTLCGSKQVP